MIIRTEAVVWTGSPFSSRDVLPVDPGLLDSGPDLRTARSRNAPTFHFLFSVSMWLVGAACVICWWMSAKDSALTAAPEFMVEEYLD